MKFDETYGHLMGPISECAAAVYEQFGTRPVVVVIHPTDWPRKYIGVRLYTPVGPVRLIKLSTCPPGKAYCMTRAQLAVVVRHERRIRAEIAKRA